MKHILALLFIIMLFVASCGGGGGDSGGVGDNGGIDNNGGNIDFSKMTQEEIITYILDTFPEPTAGTEAERKYDEPDPSWGLGDNAKRLERTIAGVTRADFDAYEASLMADGFIYYPPWEKTIGNKLYKVFVGTFVNNSYTIELVISDAVYRPTATPSNIIVTPTPTLATRVENEEIRNAEPPSILQGRRVTVTETDSASGPETTYTIHYNPAGSNETCTSVESDTFGGDANLEATVPLEAGKTTWTTKITRLRYSTVNLNYDEINPVYMICNGVRVPVTFIR